MDGKGMQLTNTSQNFQRKNLQHGFVILADRGFNIEESSVFYYAEFKVTAFTKSKKAVARSRC